jgi:hypothetical protein
MLRRGKGTNDGNDFAIAAANVFFGGFSFRQFVEDCYREAARRMSGFDSALLQPRLLPAVEDMAASGPRDSGPRDWEQRRPHLRRKA